MTWGALPSTTETPGLTAVGNPRTKRHLPVLTSELANSANVTTGPKGEGGSKDECECGCEGECMCQGEGGGERVARRQGKTECQKTTKE
jgi:hypothetical protein